MLLAWLNNTSSKIKDEVDSLQSTKWLISPTASIETHVVDLRCTSAVWLQENVSLRFVKDNIKILSSHCDENLNLCHCIWTPPCRWIQLRTLWIRWTVLTLKGSESISFIPLTTHNAAWHVADSSTCGNIATGNGCNIIHARYQRHLVCLQEPKPPD